MTLLLGVLTGNGLVSFLIALLVIAVVIYGVKLLLDWITIPDPIRKIVWLIIAVVVIIFLLNRFAGVSI